MIAEALALAGGDVLDLLGGPLGEAARAAKKRLARADQRERAEWRAVVRAPVPPGLRGVHGSWIEAALAGLPERARAAIGGGGRDGGGGGGGGGGVDVWLARWACAGIPPMLPVRAGVRVAIVDDLLALPADELAAWLRRVGDAQLRYAASLAQPGTPRAPELGAARAVIARCRGGDPPMVGARALAPHVAAHPLMPRQLAYRLPRAIGLAVLAELRAHASDPLPDAPAWRALIQ